MANTNYDPYAAQEMTSTEDLVLDILRDEYDAVLDAGGTKEQAQARYNVRYNQLMCMGIF